MDTSPPHETPDGHDASSAAHELLNQEGERDLLDEPVLPLLGLSGGTLAAVFFGGALGTLAALPPRGPPSDRIGRFPVGHAVGQLDWIARHRLFGPAD